MSYAEELFADRYRVVRPLAEGGMGTVFVAQHAATEALVALKVLSPDVLGLERARLSFELEAKVAARVRSEHIVKVLDAGVDSRTRAPFLVMELLEGVTLAEQVRQGGPQPWIHVVDWIIQTARGLDAAHGYRNASGCAEPIIHRDLKPENLFLTANSHGAPLVKILDFGIAKVLGESTHLSREVRGTPLYMAYEQAAGEELSPGTDVWALGLIAYFLLTGRCYWRSTERVQSLFAEILNLPMPAASERASEDAPGLVLPRGFDAWMFGCIDRDPNRRFASAGQAAQALAALDGASVVPAIADGEALRGPAMTAAMTGSVPSLTTAVSEQRVVARARRKSGAAIVTAAGAGLVLLLVAAWLILAGRAKDEGASVGASAQWTAPGARSVTAPDADSPQGAVVSPSSRPLDGSGSALTPPRVEVASPVELPRASSSAVLRDASSQAGGRLVPGRPLRPPAPPLQKPAAPKKKTPTFVELPP